MEKKYVNSGRFYIPSKIKKNYQKDYLWPKAKQFQKQRYELEFISNDRYKELKGLFLKINNVYKSDDRNNNEQELIQIEELPAFKRFAFRTGNTYSYNFPIFQNVDEERFRFNVIKLHRMVLKKNNIIRQSGRGKYRSKTDIEKVRKGVKDRNAIKGAIRLLKKYYLEILKKCKYNESKAIGRFKRNYRPVIQRFKKIDSVITDEFLNELSKGTNHRNYIVTDFADKFIDMLYPTMLPKIKKTSS